jgi:PII-like signaling protein
MMNLFAVDRAEGIAVDASFDAVSQGYMPGRIVGVLAKFGTSGTTLLRGLWGNARLTKIESHSQIYILTL